MTLVGSSEEPRCTTASLYDVTAPTPRPTSGVVVSPGITDAARLTHINGVIFEKLTGMQSTWLSY